MNKLERLQEKLYKQFVDEPYKNAGESRGLTITVRQDAKDPTLIRVRASSMYEYVPLNFGIMKMISEALGTTNINEGSRCCQEGCETCDFGSVYEWTLVCKECRL
jgi:hypothetical protein